MKIIAETTRFYIRQFAPDEAHLLLALNNDKMVMRYNTQRSQQETADIFSQLIADYQLQTSAGRWAIIERGSEAFIGTSMITQPAPQSPIRELGFTLHRKFWAQGIGSQVADLMAGYAFYELHLRELHAVTQPENTASRRILEKQGFRVVSQHRHEGRLYQLYRLVNPVF